MEFQNEVDGKMSFEPKTTATLQRHFERPAPIADGLRAISGIEERVLAERRRGARDARRVLSPPVDPVLRRAYWRGVEAAMREVGE